MKKNLILSFLCFFFLSLQAKAQIANEINAYVDSTEVMVIKGRKLFIQKLTQKDDKKANEIYQYLVAISSNNNTSAFNYTEHIQLNLLLGNWKSLTTCMKEYRQKAKTFTYPASDLLAQVLYERILPVANLLWLECQQSGLDRESQNAIELIIQVLKSESDEKYDRLYHKYKREYKQSMYSDFVNNYLPVATVKGSVSLSGGAGPVIPTGKLAESFSPDLKSHLSLDFSINKVFISFYLSGSGLDVKKPFSAISATDSLFFEKDETFSYFEGGLKTGYFIVRNNWLQMAPYVNLSGTNMESTRFDHERDKDREFVVLNSFTFGPGIHSALKLYQYDNKAMKGFPDMFYLALKLDAGYNLFAKYDQKYFKGNTPNFTIGLVYGLGCF